MSFWEHSNRYRGNIHIGRPTNTRLLTRHTTSSAKSAVRTLTHSDDATKHSVTEGRPRNKSRLTTRSLARPHLVGERRDDLVSNVVEHLRGIPHETFLNQREVVRVLRDVGAQGVRDLDQLPSPISRLMGSEDVRGDSRRWKQRGTRARLPGPSRSLRRPPAR